MTRISILMYHQVGHFRPMSEHRANYCLKGRFARQMWMIKLLGFEVIGLDQAMSGLEGRRPLARRSVVLTFDDGYDNFYHHAWPILERHGYPVTVYLVAGKLGKEIDWFEPDRRPFPRILNLEQVLELKEKGVEFGSHTLTHVRLAEAEPSRVRREVMESKRELERLLGHEIRHFCYPYGSYDLETIGAVEEAGYETAVTCLRGAATREFHPLELPRKAVSFGDSLVGFLWKLLVKNRPKGRPLMSRGQRVYCPRDRNQAPHRKE